VAIQDKELQCADCGASFMFTAREQEFYQTKGFTNEPKRCPTCRGARRNQKNGNIAGPGESPARQMFRAVCAECGKETQVPFQPKDDRPVYCRDCYLKNKETR